MIVGMNWNLFTNLQKKIAIIANLFVYIVLAVYYRIGTGQYILTGELKYPPRLYYLAYSLGVAFLLYEIIKRIPIKNKYVNKVCMFYSSFSLWFYLWHILVLQIVYRITDIDILKFILVMSMTTVILVLQKAVVSSLRSKRVPESICNLFEG